MTKRGPGKKKKKKMESQTWTTPSLRHIRGCERTLLAAPTPRKEDRVKLSSALQ